jgi:two-component system, LuxR family, sensor kinase FixL
MRNGRLRPLLLHDEARGKMQRMVTQSHPEPRNLAFAGIRELLSANPVARTLLAFCCFEVAYYFAYRYGMSFSQATASPFWFPDSVLLCALLRLRPRWWLLLIAGTVPIRFFSEVAADVPFAMLISTAANDYLKAVIAAVLLRRFMTDPVRFLSVRDFGIFGLIAVLAVPALSAFAGAASRGFGPEYWANWERWFLGDALAQLIVTPFIFYWVFRTAERRHLSPAQWIEALALLAGLVVSLTLAFQPASDHLGFADSRLYAPVAFLFWAAVRFGMPGATAATAILTCFAVAATLSAEGPYSEQTKNAAASGLQQFLLLRAAPLYLVAVLLEQAKRVQQSLHDSERRFRDMADSAPVMTWITGVDGGCEFFNKGWLDFTGRALSQERGEGWAQGVHPDDRTRCLAIYHSSFSARCEFEMDYRLRRHDGVYRWILDRGVPRYDENGKFLGFIGSSIDVTDRRRQESALRQSEERYRAVVDSQTELVCRFTADTTLTFVNEAYCRFLGKRRDTLLGSKLTACLPAETREHLGRSVSHALSGAGSGEWECEMTYPDGSRGWQHWICHAIDGGRETPVEVQAIGHDITDRKRAEQAHRQLAHTARLAAVGELTALVAHEINQPLCAILSNAEAAETLLNRENPPLDQIREIIVDIRNDDLRADEVIRGIRSLVGRREINIQPTDLNTTIAHVLRLVSGDAMYRRVRIKHTLDDSLPLVAADQPQIEQVLLNLIVNGMDAMHATPEGSRELTVQTRMSGADLVEVAVVDCGCGIPPERLAELFDSFFTTKAEGMGVGLSIARWIVMAHGGRIWAANVEGGGAEFRFTLRTAAADQNLTTDS